MTVVMKNWEPLLGGVSASLGRETGDDVRVGAGVGHGEQTGLVVLQLEVLVGELLAVDGLATSTL